MAYRIDSIFAGYEEAERLFHDLEMGIRGGYSELVAAANFALVRRADRITSLERTNAGLERDLKLAREEAASWEKKYLEAKRRSTSMR